MAQGPGQPRLPQDIEERERDLGFGRVLSEQRQLRLLNRDGSFNVYRERSQPFRHLWSYHFLLTLSWRRFFALIGLAFVFINAAFATVYYLLGPGTILGSVGVENQFLRCFFFSVDTFATIGYGNLSPSGVAAHAVVSFESLFALMAFAVATGMVFARFSRPTANIIYSKNAIIAPYGDGSAFEFRIINGGANELIDVAARVVFTRFEDSNGSRIRRYYNLPLERDRVAFFPLAWTIVHPIDNASPLFGSTAEDLVRSRAEFLILLTATDETFSQIVQSRSSYMAEELVCNVRFASLFTEKDSTVVIDMDRFHATEPADIPRVQ